MRYSCSLSIIITLSLTSVLCVTQNYEEQYLPAFVFASMIEFEETLVRQAAEIRTAKNLSTFDWKITVGKFNKNAAELHDFFVLVLREVKRTENITEWIEFRNFCKSYFHDVEVIAEELTAHYHLILEESAEVRPKSGRHKLFLKNNYFKMVPDLKSQLFWSVIPKRSVVEKTFDVTPVKERIRYLDMLYLDLSMCITNRKRFLTIAKSCPIIKSFVEGAKANDNQVMGRANITELIVLNECLEKYDQKIEYDVNQRRLLAFIGILTPMHHFLQHLKEELGKMRNEFFRILPCEQQLNTTEAVVDELVEDGKKILEDCFVFPSTLKQYHMWLANIAAGELYPVRENCELRSRPLKGMLNKLNESYMVLYKCSDQTDDFYQSLKNDTGCSLPIVEVNININFLRLFRQNYEKERVYNQIKEIAKLHTCVNMLSERIKVEKDGLNRNNTGFLLIITALYVHNSLKQLQRNICFGCEHEWNNTIRSDIENLFEVYTSILKAADVIPPNKPRSIVRLSKAEQWCREIYHRQTRFLGLHNGKFYVEGLKTWDNSFDYDDYSKFLGCADGPFCI